MAELAAGVPLAQEIPALIELDLDVFEPHLIVIRPADASEVAEAWRAIMPLQHEPVALVLSRQALPTIDRAKYGSAAGVSRGAYVVADAPGGAAQVLLLGTGSEVRVLTMIT
mgnify:CR=1 FL=1